MPTRYFNRALCMSPTEAENCHRWHLRNFRGMEQEDDKPLSCPIVIDSPIILVYGHEPDRQKCEAWVNRN